MIKKITLATLICLHSINWAFSFPDPCNWFDSDKKEVWFADYDDKLVIEQPQEKSRTVRKNNYCPPANKNYGRNANTCLLRKDYPSITNPYYENICAEETKDSNYFTPKIRVRGQQCNSFFCWSTNTTLDWDGECVILASSYGLPSYRMCARLALPEDKEKQTEADKGYTKGVHLDSTGTRIKDKLFKDKDGNEIILDKPKLCLYKDPFLLSPIISPDPTKLDPIDFNPVKQPLHKTDKNHPIVAIILFFMKQNPSGNPMELLGDMFDLIGNENEFLSTLKDIFSFLNSIPTLDTLMKKEIEEIAKLNNNVDYSDDYGCVELPEGPYPPPFCDRVLVPPQRATIQAICTKDQDSTDSNPCVVSEFRNNFIYNSVRVGYDNFIPLCDASNYTKGDRCVSLDGVRIEDDQRLFLRNLGLSSPDAIHAQTNKLDIIHKCSNNSSLCFEDALSNIEKIRLVYADKVGNSFSPKPYFDESAPICGVNNIKDFCQVLWGVNIGDFQDINIRIPNNQNAKGDEILPIKSNAASLSNIYGKRSDFYAEINYSTGEDSQICVYKKGGKADDEIADCVKRASPPKLTISDCDKASEYNVSCNKNNYFNPKFIISYEEGEDKISDVVIPKSADGKDKMESIKDLLSLEKNRKKQNKNQNSENEKDPSEINLGGSIFNSFVTNDEFITEPFEDYISIIFGEYKDNNNSIVKISETNAPEINNSLYYVRGLEIIYGTYRFGGKYACVMPKNLKTCPEDETMCVLTKRLNTDIVRCDLFVEKLQEFGFSKCTPEEKVCPIVADMSKISGGSIDIKKCIKSNTSTTPESTITTICYDHPEDLCTISYSLKDRIEPKPLDANSKPSLEDIKLDDKEYYHIDNDNIPSHENALRSKTSIELGLCNIVPEKDKDEKTFCEGETKNHVVWLKANLGDVSKGSCEKGYEKVDPDISLDRLCIPTEERTFILEPLDKMKEKAKNMKCIKIDEEEKK